MPIFLCVLRGEMGTFCEVINYDSAAVLRLTFFNYPLGYLEDHWKDSEVNQ